MSDVRTTWDVTADGTRTSDSDDASVETLQLGLLIAWSRHAARRVGEVMLVPPGQAIALGRGGVSLPATEHQGTFARQRPRSTVHTGCLDDPTISRRQLVLSVAAPGMLHVENVGRSALHIDGRPAERGEVRPGSVLRIGTRLVLLCVLRPVPYAPTPSWPDAAHTAFGHADSNGLVGESPMAWMVREQIGFIAKRPHHVLVVGQSGVGKELVARAIHRMSERGDKPLMARNAATIPSGLIDAELFGNVRGYPNPGMAERPGIVGAADGTTLFLDEIGELPEELQAHLLRVLDAGGEYQRLGDARHRTSNFRLVAATNRQLSELRHDLVPRLTLRVALPGLNERRGDIPLLINHILGRAAAQDVEVAKRFAQLDGTVRTSPSLVEALVAHRYTHHVRELDALLWQAIATSTGDKVTLTSAVAADLAESKPDGDDASAPLPDADTVRASLERHRGVQERVWRELGLNNRFVLRRLIKKYGLAGRR